MHSFQNRTFSRVVLEQGEVINADRFLNAIVELEELLRAEAQLNADGVGDLKTWIDKSKVLTVEHKRKLHKWRSLRNVIVHSTKVNATPIADPRDSEVVEIERLVRIVKNPPRVVEVLELVPPRVLSWDSEISDFFSELMPPHEYSQAPYLDQNGSHCLITSNAVARWAATNYESASGVIIDRSRIIDVAAYAEEGDRLVCLKKDLTAKEAIEILTDAQGTPPAAILLTDTGHETGRAMGLAVRADLPNLFRATQL